MPSPVTRFARLSGALLAATLTAPVWASSVSYQMTQSNEAAFPDGSAPYLSVTIADDVLAPTANGSVITFTVQTLSGLDPYTAGSNFGIQSFGFNVVAVGPSLSDSPNAMWILPADWDAKVAPPPNQISGFGRFDVDVGAVGSNRLSTLQFSIDVAGDDIFTYFDSSSTQNGNPPGEGYAWFAAHVAFGSELDPPSAFFGASDDGVLPPTAVPVPAALWMFGGALLGIAGIARRQRT